MARIWRCPAQSIVVRNWYRITNNFSGISFVVKGYRGEVYRREEGLREWETPFVWKPVSSARLKRELGICNERENSGGRLEGSGMKFASAEHQGFFEDTMKHIKELWGKDDTYHQAFFYLMGLTDETRRHIRELFAFDNDSVNPEALDAAWQTGSTVRLCRLAFNLWNGYVEEEEGEEFSPYDLFACSLAPYFVVALRLRFPDRKSVV